MVLTFQGGNHESQTEARLYLFRCSNYAYRDGHRLNFFSSPLIAGIELGQNAIFDQVLCKELVVVDENGNFAIQLSTDELDNSVVIFDKAGNLDIGLVGNNGHTGVYVKQSGKLAFRVLTLPSLNSVDVFDSSEKNAFDFTAGFAMNPLIVHNKSSGAGIGFYGDPNEARQTKWNPPKERNNR
jgi:hypothetical protein